MGVDGLWSKLVSDAPSVAINLSLGWSHESPGGLGVGSISVSPLPNG